MRGRQKPGWQEFESTERTLFVVGVYALLSRYSVFGANG